MCCASSRSVPARPVASLTGSPLQRSLAGVTQLQFFTSNVSCDSKAFGLGFCGLTSRACPSTRVAKNMPLKPKE